MLDEVFGKENYINEITWKRYAVHSLSRSRFDNVSDILLFYSTARSEMNFNGVYGGIEEAEIEKRFPHTESETGRRFQHVALEQSSNQSSAGESRIINGREVQSEIGWRWTQETFDKRLSDNPYLIYWTKNGRPRYKIYVDEYKGKPIGNIWVDVPYLSAGDKEHTKYPTQKPLALLERIIKATSNPGDIVLDPFCGCATTCVAAEKLDRQWIGIDISEKAIDLVRFRLGRDLGLFSIKVIHRTDPPTDRGGKKSPDIKHLLFGKQEGFCNGCGVSFHFRNFTLDHIVPRDKGGADMDDNLQLLCGYCNSVKGNRTQEYLLAKLKENNVIGQGSFGEHLLHDKGRMEE